MYLSLFDYNFSFCHVVCVYDVESCGKGERRVACGQGATVVERAADGVDGYFGRCGQTEIYLAVVAPYTGFVVGRKFVAHGADSVNADDYSSSPDSSCFSISRSNSFNSLSEMSVCSLLS